MGGVCHAPDFPLIASPTYTFPVVLRLHPKNWADMGSIWGFPKTWLPKNASLIICVMENPSIKFYKWMIWGYPKCSWCINPCHATQARRPWRKETPGCLRPGRRPTAWWATWTWIPLQISLGLRENLRETIALINNSQGKSLEFLIQFRERSEVRLNFICIYSTSQNGGFINCGAANNNCLDTKQGAYIVILYCIYLSILIQSFPSL